ncbi:carboxypeptidase M32 [Anaerolineales bacterium HSG25]|nr:carboxypeptidase M32 [Anaerolineales bacterium HSG25]
MQEKLNTLKSKLKDITNLQKAAAVLIWDQEVNMPPGGAEARAEQLATLQKLSHEMFVSDEIGVLLGDLAQVDFDYDSDDAALIRVTRRDYDKTRKLSTELVEEMSRTFALGQHVWAKARQNKNFAEFQDTLAKVVDLNIQAAEAYGYDECLYDALLDDFEPNMKTSEVRTVFDELKATLVPLVAQISERVDAVDNSLLQQNYPNQAQWDFSMVALEAIGFDLKRGRQDKSTHPFSISFSVNDSRVTTRISEDTFPSSLFSTLHEGGHGMYEQNIGQSLDGTPLAGGTSLGVHESQSRMWENILGRSQPFWQFYYPQLQNAFPDQLGQADMNQFYRAINKVEPSLIRVEADEVTYNLHVFLRFELEQELLEQRLKIADLPAAWNAKMEEYLGLTPPDDALGVLQDVHWSGGMMGYFPTYTLGNIMSVQFYNQTLKEIPDLPQQFARGEFGALLSWFTENIHQHGRKYTANELLKRVAGSDTIDAKPYLGYIQQKFGEIYNL